MGAATDTGAEAKTAVVLLNLGGPDSAAAIRPFLKNFFMDPLIVRLPAPVRWLLSELISRKRSRAEAGVSYGHLGGASPLLANTQAQARALQEQLGPGHRVFACMRYWHPMAGEVVREIGQWGASRIVLLPLYPQYSTTTTLSSFRAFRAEAEKQDLRAAVSGVCCYPLLDGFIAESARRVRAAYDTAQKETGRAPRLLFSAHGLPESIVRAGDPYQWQCERSAEAIARAAGLEGADWRVCYQSRVGRQKWIGPSTADELRRAAADKKPLVIYPHAFVSEHVETLVEIDIEYRRLAAALGVPGFFKVDTVGADAAFIGGLAALVRAHGAGGIKPEQGARLCPENFGGCCQDAFACL
jgi:ferrochelatase